MPTESLRVLRVLADLQVGGVQRMLLRSLRCLRDMGVESEVCCQKSRGALADDFEKEGFRVHLVRFSSRMDPRGLLALRRLGNCGGFDIVHAHQYQSNIAANLAFLGQRSMAVINSYHSFLPVHTKRQASMVCWTRNSPSQIVAVSDAVREAVANLGLPEDRIQIVHNGFDAGSPPKPMPSPRPKEPLRLLYAGRFVEQKQVWFLVDVVKACRERGLPVHCALAGDGPGRKEIRQRVEEAGLQSCFEMPGFVNDVRPWLDKAHLYVSASRREGFSNALLECCAAGRPFVASDIPPHREMLGESQAGRVVPLEPTLWAQALEEIAASDRLLETMSAAALERVQRFSVRATCLRTMEVYRAALEKPYAFSQPMQVPSALRR